MKRIIGLVMVLPITILGVQVQYLKNEKLQTIQKSYPGNKIIDGRFVEYVSETKGIPDLIKWKMDENAKYDGYTL